MKDFLIALAHFTAEYHSGQWSKGYRLLSLTNLYLRRWFQITHPLDMQMSKKQWLIYEKLVNKHKGEM